MKNAKFSSKTKQLVLPMTHAQTFGNEELTLQVVKKVVVLQKVIYILRCVLALCRLIVIC